MKSIGRSLPVVLAALLICQALAAQKYANIGLALESQQLKSTQQLLSVLNKTLYVANKNQVVTLLAPTEAAFASYLASLSPPLTRQQFFSKANLVRSIGLYQILSNVAKAPEDLLVNMTIRTDLGQYVTAVNVWGQIGFQGGLANNTARILQSYACGKGILLIIDRVLVPDLAPVPSPSPSPSGQTLGPYATSLSAIQQIPSISDLYSLFLAAGNPQNLTQRLSNPDSKLTVFAFVNSALPAALSKIGLSQDDFAHSPFMPMMLAYQVMDGAYTEQQLVQATKPTSVFGLTKLQIYQTPSREIIVNGYQFSTKIVSAAIKAGSSYVYLVDNVMLAGGLNFAGPTFPAAAILRSDSLNMLASLDQSTNGLATLDLTNTNSIVTFLAPSDDAIAKYLAKKKSSLALLGSNTMAAVRMLSAQCVTSFNPMATIQTGTTVFTRLGTKLNIAVYGGRISLKPNTKQAAVNILSVAGQGPSWVVYITDAVLE